LSTNPTSDDCVPLKTQKDLSAQELCCFPNSIRRCLFFWPHSSLLCVRSSLHALSSNSKTWLSAIRSACSTARSGTPELTSGDSPLLGLAVPHLARLAIDLDHREAGNGRSLASPREFACSGRKVRHGHPDDPSLRVRSVIYADVSLVAASQARAATNTVHCYVPPRSNLPSVATSSAPSSSPVMNRGRQCRPRFLYRWL